MQLQQVFKNCSCQVQLQSVLFETVFLSGLVNDCTLKVRFEKGSLVPRCHQMSTFVSVAWPFLHQLIGAIEPCTLRVHPKQGEGRCWGVAEGGSQGISPPSSSREAPPATAIPTEVGRP